MYISARCGLCVRVLLIGLIKIQFSKNPFFNILFMIEITDFTGKGWVVTLFFRG